MEKPIKSHEGGELKEQISILKNIHNFAIFLFFCCVILKTKIDDLGPFAVEGNI